MHLQRNSFPRPACKCEKVKACHELAARKLACESLRFFSLCAAFNTVGVEQLGAPDGTFINGQKLTMLFVGPADKKKVAASVVEGVGFIPKYVGPIRYARNLDAIAELWIHLSIPPAGETREDWGRNFHFQVIEKP